MREWASDLIIAIAVIIGWVVFKKLPYKIKWWWRAAIGILLAIILSIIGHLVWLKVVAP